MGIDSPTTIVLGSLRNKTATDTDGSEKIVLEGTNKEIVEYERTIDVNALQVFDDERQESEIYRPTSKYDVIFKNAYSGITTYPPYRDYLYYVNIEESAGQVLCGAPFNIVPWFGYPQYSEFDFERTDNSKVGYTSGLNNHQDFLNISATTYNWTHYLSYPFDNDYNQQLFANDPTSLVTWNWVASDGIPFVIISNSDNIIRFKCPMSHGLITGEYVQLSFDYNGTTVFTVDSLGDGGSGSEFVMFNLFNIGYLGTTFDVGVTGTFKRVLDPINSGETTSKYYVRVNKILTNTEDAILVKAAFEQNIFNGKSKLEKVLSGFTPTLTVLTPPTLPRTSILEGSQSYTLSFNRDIDVSLLIDNQKRPITELFFTTIWKGYYGWTDRLKKGYYFNVYLDSSIPNQWWDLTNPLSDSTIVNIPYTSNLGVGPFYYNQDLFSGDTIDGDYCEWNDYEQLERVISRQINKFTFNQSWFTQLDSSPNTKKFGYYYYPHNPITIKVYSDYVEEGDALIVEGIPNYAFYSNMSNSFRWRDIYPYGFVDNLGNGVDYPFSNGRHYPFKNTIFRIFSEGSGIADITQIAEPTIDECE